MTAYHGSSTDVIVPDEVCIIGPGCFEKMNGIRSVHLPKQLQRIEENAFLGCSALSDVFFPEDLLYIGKNAFSQCTSLSEIILPESVTRIDNDAFCGCANLQKVLIPGSVKYVGNSAFSGCSNLNTITISNGVTEIGSLTFAACTSIKEIAFPNTVTSIGSDVMAGCTSLCEVRFSNGLVNIGSGAFENCTMIKRIEFPETVKSIGTATLHGCTNLCEVHFPPSNSDMKRQIFCHDDRTVPDYNITCSKLTDIYIGNRKACIPNDREIIMNCLMGTPLNWQLRDLYEVLKEEKRCPFCGGWIEKRFWAQTVYCTGCGHEFGYHYTSSEYYVGLAHGLGLENIKKIKSNKWYDSWAKETQ